MDGFAFLNAKMSQILPMAQQPICSDEQPLRVDRITGGLDRVPGMLTSWSDSAPLWTYERVCSGRVGNIADPRCAFSTATKASISWRCYRHQRNIRWHLRWVRLGLNTLSPCLVFPRLM